MTSLDIVGGVYREVCFANNWEQVFGSAGRAAAAIRYHVDQVNLWTYSQKDVAFLFNGYAATYGFAYLPTDAPQSISFEYVHSLSEVIVRPSKEFIQQLSPLEVECEAILRFGMIESTAKVTAKRCVYDPQSEFTPEEFTGNGSTAEHLAIVGNETEVRLLGKNADIKLAANALLNSGCEVVVVKAGPEGAFIFTVDGMTTVPAFQTNFVWTLGTGDVFAAIFAAHWAANHTSPEFAAQVASRAVASYVETMSVPVPNLGDLFAKNRLEVSSQPGKVYIAAPFFNLPQRWILEEAIRCLKNFGMEVFSPFHEVGLGGDEVALPDLQGLNQCDRVLAFADGLDSGTLFELGYATKLEKPVYVYTESASPKELIMLSGTGARIIPDFVTAIHWVTWKI